MAVQQQGQLSHLHGELRRTLDAYDEELQQLLHVSSQQQQQQQQQRDTQQQEQQQQQRAAIQAMHETALGQ